MSKLQESSIEAVFQNNYLGKPCGVHRSFMSESPYQLWDTYYTGSLTSQAIDPSLQVVELLDYLSVLAPLRLRASR